MSRLHTSRVNHRQLNHSQNLHSRGVGTRDPSCFGQLKPLVGSVTGWDPQKVTKLVGSHRHPLEQPPPLPSTRHPQAATDPEPVHLSKHKLFRHLRPV